MKIPLQMSKARMMLPVALVSMLVIAGCATPMRDEGHRVVLQGSQEVPPANTAAVGGGVIAIRPDRSLSGSITTTGINSTAAHIHEATRGANGPVIVPLVRTDANVWSMPAGAMVTEAQYAAHRAGNLYVNVHSTAYPNGEIRAQIDGN